LPCGYLLSSYACIIPKIRFDMMYPLVDECRNNPKRKISKTLRIAEEKSRVVMRYAFAITFVLMIAEQIHRMIF
jgi:hypothetical protein